MAGSTRHGVEYWLAAPYRPFLQRQRNGAPSFAGLVEQLSRPGLTRLTPSSYCGALRASGFEALNASGRNVLAACVLGARGSKCELMLASYHWSELAKLRPALQTVPPHHGGALPSVKVVVSMPDGELRDFGGPTEMPLLSRPCSLQERLVMEPRPDLAQRCAPSDLRGVISLLKQAGETQDDKEVERLSASAEIVRDRELLLGEPSRNRRAWPDFLVDSPQLSSQMLERLIRRARMFDALLGPGGPRGLCGRIFPALNPGGKALIISEQPSMRTVLAAHAACEMVGVDPVIFPDGFGKKGESLPSQLATFVERGVRFVFLRSKGSEAYAASLAAAAKELRAHGLEPPTFVNMGGNDTHPLQTLGNLFALGEHFRVKEKIVETLRRRTPRPTMAFVGAISHKRVDVSFMRFVHHRLGWPIRVIVPHESYVPKLGFAVDLRVNPAITHREVLVRETRGATVVHLSNAEATRNTDTHGSGQGFGPAIFDASGLTGRNLLHPLPSGPELNAALLYDSQLIAAEMRGVLTCAAAFMSVAMDLAADRTCGR